MGISYEELLKRAERFKETVWYFLEIHKGKIENDPKIREMVNDLLDTLDELPFEN